MKRFIGFVEGVMYFVVFLLGMIFGGFFAYLMEEDYHRRHPVYRNRQVSYKTYYDRYHSMREDEDD